MTRRGNDAQRHAREAEEGRSSGPARLLPKVTFGLGAAVLAGVVVVSVSPVPTTARATGRPVITTTAGLGAAINAVAGNAGWETTCCGGRLLLQ